MERLIIENLNLKEENRKLKRRIEELEYTTNTEGKIMTKQAKIIDKLRWEKRRLEDELEREYRLEQESPDTVLR